MKNIKTVLHAYSFYINEPEGKAAYAELCERMKAAGVKCFETHGGGSHYMPEIEGYIELETKHIFDNQWNSAPRANGHNGYRIFDWAQDYLPNRNPHLKRGHWLEMTDEMRAVRLDTHACGYCGRQCAAADATPFCPHCIGSEYLTPKDFPLTRMQPVNIKRDRAALTESELTERVALWKVAQIHGTTERDKKRIADRRARILADYEKVTKNALTERDGMLWLMDRGITESAIYYSHTGRFGFGWRRDVPDELRADLLESLAEFPFPYDIK